MNVPEHRQGIMSLSQAVPRGNTDASEQGYRRAQHKVAEALLDMAGDIMDEAVQGGMDLEHSSAAEDMLLLAVALSCQVTACIPKGDAK